uniref:Reverse transcriptase zinc-binding domain-containing protein n=1 Tax=Cannabis sativa TaxID=3483 RepID=A0A803NQ36_CANSA
MKQGLLWKVGNGNTIRTIEDHWLPDFRIKSYSSPPPSESTHSLFISPSRAWDSLKLHQFFDDQLVDSILNVPISGNNCQDDLFWSKNNSGLFSVKIAYHLTLTSRNIPSSSSFSQSKHFWSRIWSSSAPPKLVRHLVWRVLSSSIPAASSLFHRRVIPSPICPICHMKWKTGNMLYLNAQVYSPPTGCWKINTDAGISNTAKKHSLGIVVRDDCDNIKAGLIVLIVGLVPPEVAEAKAILTALSWLQATKLPVTVL